MRKYIVTGAVLFATSTAAAEPPAPAPPIPAHQWDAETEVWLARAMVAEAGWDAEHDHIAIAYVLAKRWRKAVERWPQLRFIDILRNYCAGLGDYRRALTPRQRWLRSLNPEGTQPDGWPTQASWRNHLPLWQKALARARAWGEGTLRDPCKGRAWHWGGSIDSPRGRMVRVECGETRNTFYRLDLSLRDAN